MSKLEDFLNQHEATLSRAAEICDMAQANAKISPAQKAFIVAAALLLGKMMQGAFEDKDEEALAELNALVAAAQKVIAEANA